VSGFEESDSDFDSGKMAKLPAAFWDSPPRAEQERGLENNFSG
jgi:hypothetical protein